MLSPQFSDEWPADLFSGMNFFRAIIIMEIQAYESFVFKSAKVQFSSSVIV